MNISALKLINIVMVNLTTLTLMLLFLPLDQIAPQLYDKVQSARFYLYLALLAEAAHFLSFAVLSVISRILQRRAEKKADLRIQQCVQTMDFAEKALLREFVLQRKSLLTLPVEEPSVSSLYEQGILSLSAFVDPQQKTGEFYISKAARPYITYKAIGLSRVKMTEEQLHQIKLLRPVFAKGQGIGRVYRTSEAMARAA